MPGISLSAQSGAPVDFLPCACVLGGWAPGRVRPRLVCPAGARGSTSLAWPVLRSPWGCVRAAGLSAVAAESLISPHVPASPLISPPTQPIAPLAPSPRVPRRTSQRRTASRMFSPSSIMPSRCASCRENRGSFCCANARVNSSLWMPIPELRPPVYIDPSPLLPMYFSALLFTPKPPRYCVLTHPQFGEDAEVRMPRETDFDDAEGGAGPGEDGANFNSGDGTGGGPGWGD